MVDITSDDLLQALLAAQDAADAPADGLTRQEIMAATGWGRQTVINRLQDLYNQGRLEVGKRRVRNMAGYAHYKPVYKLKREVNEQ